jgi:hypothetical protein
MTTNSLRHRLPLLPPGTKVRRVDGEQLGTVQKYGMEHSSGCFPVRWDLLWEGSGAVWETCGFDDVLVVRQSLTHPRSVAS